MVFQEELGLLIRARYPLIYIPTREEERAEDAIAAVATTTGGRAVYTWDFVDGYRGNPNDVGVGRRNPLQALEFVEKLSPDASAILILRDFHRFLDDIAVSRKLRNLARLLKSQPKNIIILSAQLTIPDELSELLTVLEFPLPRVDEIHHEIETLLGAMGNLPDPKAMDALVRSCQGLSMERIRRVPAQPPDHHRYCPGRPLLHSHHRADI